VREPSHRERTDSAAVACFPLPGRTLLRMQVSIAVMLLACLPTAARAADSCLDCHKVMEGTSIPFQNDIHFKRGLSCADCHGGDPNSPDQNISMSAAKGFRVRVTREGVAEFCGRCHGNAAVMQKHNPKARVDQVTLYAASVHAGKSSGGDGVAATCVDCHDVHKTRAVSDPQSSVAPARLARTCGKCHADSSAQFQKSAHAAVFVTGEMRSCAACHSSHATARGDDMLAGGRAVCSTCHEPDSKGGRTAAALGRTLETARMAMFRTAPPRTDAPRGAIPAAATPAGPGVQGRGATPGGRGGFRVTDPRIKKALSLVHALDVPAVKAAVEAIKQQ
jgi:predicted CXXCH cytochrome family protein